MPDRSFWRSHALAPAVAFVVLAALFELTNLDRWLAWHWAFDVDTGRFVGAGSWWADELVHRGGRMFVRALAVSVLVAWIVSFWSPSLRSWRGALLLVWLALALVPLLVGVLKHITNVDCPRSLEEFGGTRPYVRLFDDRPDDLPHAACFPGAHSSSAFALVAFYFALRDRSRRLARGSLAAGLVLGALFSAGQQARGAHFVSHDVWSAFAAWFVSLGLYVCLVKFPAAALSEPPYRIGEKRDSSRLGTGSAGP